LITLCRKERFTAKSNKSKKEKKEEKKGPETPNFQERMVKVAQVLSNLSKNFFDCEPKVRFDFAVKKFCGSSLDLNGGVPPMRNR
jgi:hypothetical protein